MPKRPWTEAEDEALRKAAAEGVSLQRLAVRFNRPQVSIKNRAAALGIEIRPMTRLPASEMQHSAIRVQKRTW
jgi:hypothetical protein